MVGNGDLGLGCLVDLQQVWVEASHQRLVRDLLLTCKAVLPQDGKVHLHQVSAHLRAARRRRDIALQGVHHRQCQISSAWLLLDHMHPLLATTQIQITSARLQLLTYRCQNMQTYHPLTTARSRNGTISTLPMQPLLKSSPAPTRSHHCPWNSKSFHLAKPAQ